ncbi:unnamed protein product [Chrysodeixis includens]|uniref:Chitin-binding type-2 domain-containing protein n=1 Tax=Chrysodeixis includens TaxID=689277 RepID=A0A9N8L3B0_CHRIL|nr:unnamed protein product [Chrysodeixis includens]
MKGAVLLLLCAVVAIAQADSDEFYINGCPKDHSEQKLLPHQNCNQYYQCLNGVLLPRLCPAGLFFNTELDLCDWNGENKCHEPKSHKKNQDTIKYSKELDKGNPNHVRAICSNSDADDEVVAHEICNQFYKCTRGQPVVQICAPSLMYDITTERCDWATNVDCKGRFVPESDINVNKRDTKDDNKSSFESEELESGNQDPDQALRICSSAGSDGELVSHENCNQFYKCFNGVPVVMFCPDGLLFNAAKAYCDWPQNVYCGERVTPGNDDNVETTVALNNHNHEGELVTVSVKDDDKNIQHNGNSDPNQAVLICKALNADGVLVAHENCRHFYKCFQGYPVELSCPGILLYNADQAYCDWPNNVDCGDRYTEDREDDNNNNNAPVSKHPGNHDNSNDAPSICAALGSDGILVAHEKCNQFYKCHEGLPVALKCPSTLMYNSEKQYCDWPANVECGERVVTAAGNIHADDNTNDNVDGIEDTGPNAHHDPSEAPIICAVAESNGILIAHANCNQFYKCYDNKPVPLFCPLNLLYNPSKEYCDWPHNVYCGDRLLPQANDTYNEVTNKPKTTCSQYADGDVLPHENCAQFYKCLSGKGYPMDCPPGLYFNADLKVCDWPMNVQCSDREISPKTPKASKKIFRHARH